MSHIGKRYRIEQSFASPDGGVLVSGSGDGRIGEILSTVQDLRRCFEPSQRRAGEVIEAYRREIAELYGLKAELDSMKGAIASTKGEIATLRRSEDDGAGMRRAAGELDAVIEATEDATRRAEVRRGAAGPDDRRLGRPRCLQGARRRAAARARPRRARAPQRAEARGRRRPRHPGRHRRALQLKRWRVGYSAGATTARPGAKRSRAMVRSDAISKR